MSQENKTIHIHLHFGEMPPMPQLQDHVVKSHETWSGHQYEHALTAWRAVCESIVASIPNIVERTLPDLEEEKK